jgi:hypothetical protein
MKSTPLPVSRDLMELTAARLLFQRAHYSAAIKYYEKVDKTSEYWTDAQEEMAWSYIRKVEPGNALAVSTSLVTPAMAAQAGPESFFVHSLAQLKICDYPGVITSLGEYPKRFKGRNEMLTKLSSSAQTPAIKKIVDQLKEHRIARKDLSEAGRDLPRLVARDERLYRFAQNQKNLEQEAAAADRIYSKSLALTGLQGYFDKLRQTSLSRAHTAAAAANSRVQELARQEVGEVREILRKLHIVEAEVIQQVSVAERVISNVRGPITEQKGVTGSKDRDVLKFPAEKEVWFDEIGNFKVDVKKSCQAAGGKGKST